MALTFGGRSPPFGQRRERYLLVYTPTVSRFGVSHGSPGATVANVKTANSPMKIVHGVALKGGWLSPCSRSQLLLFIITRVHISHRIGLDLERIL